MTPLEKEIEQKLRKKVKALGGKCEKLVNVGFAGFPDRTILLPGERIYFVETKRPKDGKVAALQKKWRQWLTALGFDCRTIWTFEELEEFLRYIQENQ